MKRPIYPSNDFTKCPECGSEELAELSPCEGIHRLSQEFPGAVVKASWDTHTDMSATGFISCTDGCGTEWSIPEGLDWHYT